MVKIEQIRQKIVNFFRRLHLPEYVFLVLVAFIIGAIAALGSYLFLKGIELLWKEYFIPILVICQSALIYRILVPFLPLMAALSLFLLAKLFSSNIYGYGFPNLLTNVNLRGGIISIKDTFGRILGALVTLGLGGSAGQEGPIAQIGCLVGGIISRFFVVSEQRRRTFIACGSAGAIASVFNAPIAGTFFALEIVLLGDFELINFMPVVVSAGMGTIVSRILFGNKPIFALPPYSFVTYWELFFYILLGFFLGLLAYFFIRVFYTTKEYFSRLSISSYLKPFIGFFIVGIIGMFFPQIFGVGYEHVQAVLDGKMLPALMFLLVFLKIIATAITLGSGGVGGMFSPAFYIGAMAGGSFGTVVHHFFPQITASYPAYAVVGIAAFLAALTHAPVTAVFLAFEMTGDYYIILPILFASIIGVIVAYAFSHDSIDTYELTQQGINIHAGHERNILASIRVKDAMTHNVIVVPEDMTFNDFIHFVRDKKHTCFPVVNEKGELSGIISFQNFREILADEKIQKDRILVKDMSTKEIIAALPDETLEKAMEKMRYHHIERLPVVDPKDPKKLIGFLSQRDVWTAYNKALLTQMGREEEL
ncbi:MAG TPA: CBS domain-containing protein [Candidatus Desulfofervidus auxilii]|uniref:CBS domain-containing protein n=1 Tax=Desulfofervidus auxilii TaxID=1621989 RepID=A0A7V0NEB4_DESA2|nr:CBS domain-containing protein [Candidatus Desulfofervidus auxilii]